MRDLSKKTHDNALTPAEQVHISEVYSVHFAFVKLLIGVGFCSSAILTGYFCFFAFFLPHKQSEGVAYSSDYGTPIRTH